MGLGGRIDRQPRKTDCNDDRQRGEQHHADRREAPLVAKADEDPHGDQQCERHCKIDRGVVHQRPKRRCALREHDRGPANELNDVGKSKKPHAPGTKCRLGRLHRVPARTRAEKSGQKQQQSAEQMAENHGGPIGARLKAGFNLRD